MGSLDGPKTDLTEQQRESDMKETDNYSGFVYLANSDVSGMEAPRQTCS